MRVTEARPLAVLPWLKTYAITFREGLSSHANTHTHFRRSHFEDAAVLRSKHGFYSWKMSSKIDDEASKFFRDDLREDGTAATKLSFINEVSSRLEEEKPAQFPFKNEKEGPKIEEIVIPSQMRRWAASLSGLTAFLSPIMRWKTFLLRRLRSLGRRRARRTPLL